MNAPYSGMRSVASTLVLAIVLLLLVLCSLGPAGGFLLAAVPKGPQTHTVVIREAKFQPAVLTVKVGDTVEWRNDDIVPHTATSTAEPKKFDSGILPVGSSWKYVITKRGTYFYNCTLHPNMNATLIVR
jgi:plastocyanin